MALLQLYRRGPDWSACMGPPSWPPARLHGLPVADHPLNAPDFRSFAVCYLVTETLTTVVGYFIVMHLVKDHHVRFLTPSGRLWFALAFIAAKLALIDSAFHGSLYVIVSSISAFCIAVSALLAAVFHFGPLLWAFPDIKRRRRSAPFTFQEVLRTVKYFFIRQHLSLYTATLAQRDLDAAAIERSVRSKNGVAFVPGLFGNDMEIRIDEWNRWLTTHWTDTLIATGHARMQPMPSVAIDDGISESRFVFAMQTDGLILDFLLREPTATLFVQLDTTSVTPFELVLRFMVRYQSGKRLPVFLYAECAHLASKSNAAQKQAIWSMLHQLNASCNRRVDVSLRSLRCKDFVQADIKPRRRLRARPRSHFSTDLQDAFG